MDFVIKPKRPWWRQKRFQWPALALALFAGGLAMAFFRSGVSTIVVYNETGQPLRSLRVVACGQATTFPGVPERGSVRVRLNGAGEGSPIGVETSADTICRWSGGYVEPRGGYRATIRIYPENQVEAHTQISWWQRAFFGTTPVDE